VDWEERLFATFDDLEQQAAALYDAERAAELGDRTRAEYAAVTLAGRLMASVDDEVALDVPGAGIVTGRLVRVAGEWCLLERLGHDWIVPLAAVAAVTGSSGRAVPEVAWPAVARLGLGSALRRLADAGEPVVVHRRDGGRHELVPTRVGADFVEGRVPDGRSVLVAFGAVAAVQSAST
jgi:hypothetical protein